MKFFVAVALCLMAGQTAWSSPHGNRPLLPGAVYHGRSVRGLVPHGPLVSEPVPHVASPVLVIPLANKLATEGGNDNVGAHGHIALETLSKAIEHAQDAVETRRELEKQASHDLATEMGVQAMKQIEGIISKSASPKSDSSESHSSPSSSPLSSESDESSDTKIKVVKEIGSSKKGLLAKASAALERLSSDMGGSIPKHVESSMVKKVSLGQADEPRIALGQQHSENIESKTERVVAGSGAAHVGEVIADLVHLPAAALLQKSERIEEAILKSGQLAEAVIADAKAKLNSNVREAIAKSSSRKPDLIVVSESSPLNSDVLDEGAEKLLHETVSPHRAGHISSGHSYSGQSESSNIEEAFSKPSSLRHEEGIAVHPSMPSLHLEELQTKSALPHEHVHEHVHEHAHGHTHERGDEAVIAETGDAFENEKQIRISHEKDRLIRQSQEAAAVVAATAAKIRQEAQEALAEAKAVGQEQIEALAHLAKTTHEAQVAGVAAASKLKKAAQAAIEAKIAEIATEAKQHVLAHGQSLLSAAKEGGASIDVQTTKRIIEKRVNPEVGEESNIPAIIIKSTETEIVPTSQTRSAGTESEGAESGESPILTAVENLNVPSAQSPIVAAVENIHVESVESPITDAVETFRVESTEGYGPAVEKNWGTASTDKIDEALETLVKKRIVNTVKLPVEKAIVPQDSAVAVVSVASVASAAPAELAVSAKSSELAESAKSPELAESAKSPELPENAATVDSMAVIVTTEEIKAEELPKPQESKSSSSVSLNSNPERSESSKDSSSSSSSSSSD